jgi:hypothetical protein
LRFFLSAFLAAGSRRRDGPKKGENGKEGRGGDGGASWRALKAAMKASNP